MGGQASINKNVESPLRYELLYKIVWISLKDLFQAGAKTSKCLILTEFWWTSMRIPKKTF